MGMTCLHVSNLSSKVTETELRELFEKYGSLDYVKICMEPRT
jgi:RNA recognition motif-containing protein